MPPQKMTRDGAESVAIDALSFLAGEPELLGRFLAISGIRPDQIRAAAQAPGFYAGVLRFIAAHEPTLLAFASAAGLPPDRVLEALRRLPHGDETYDRST